jgi:hypothetical protein
MGRSTSAEEKRNEKEKETYTRKNSDTNSALH